MTLEESKYILEKHTLLFSIAENNREIPDQSHGSVQEIWSAFKFHRPDYVMDWCCGSCVFKMIEEANKIRKDLSMKFHTFPKQD